MKTPITNSNEIRPRKDICIKALYIEFILECVFIFISIFVDLASLTFVFIMPIIILYIHGSEKYKCCIRSKRNYNYHFYKQAFFLLLG